MNESRARHQDMIRFPLKMSRQTGEHIRDRVLCHCRSQGPHLASLIATAYGGVET